MNTDVLKEIDELNKTIEIEPNNPELYLRRGLAYAIKGNGENDCIIDYKKAIENYNEVIKITPDNPVVYFHIGGLYANMGEFNDALVYAKKALELNPNNYECEKLVNEIVEIMTKIKRPN